MIWFAVTVMVLVAVVLIFLRRQPADGVSTGLLPYSQVPALFTPAERSFFGVLVQATGKDFQVFGKVRVADVLSVNGGLQRSAHTKAFNRVSAKHFDFVLCSPTDLSVLCVIELNDASHRQEKRQQRDDFLEAACKAARLPLVVFPVQASYSPADLSRQIAAALIQKDGAASARSPIATESQEPAQEDGPATVAQGQAQAAPVCPKCSSPMIKRTTKGGENAGREFWGCSNFPSCRGILAT